MRLSEEKKERLRTLFKNVRDAIDTLPQDANKIIVWEREEFMQTMSFFGWKKDDVFDILYDLQINDYYRGPSPNRNVPSFPEVWEFNYRYQGRDIYIKLSYGDHNTGYDTLLIMSFHIDRIDLSRMK